MREAVISWHYGAMPKRSSPKRDFMEVARGVVEHAIGEQMDGSPLQEPAPDTRNPHAVALGSMGGRKGGSLRVTPAMEAGISDHVWSIEDLCGLLPENHRIGMQVDKALIQKALGEKVS